MSKNLSEHSKKITPPNLDAWNKQMYRVRVFDELIYDTDEASASRRGMRSVLEQRLKTTALDGV
jgi:hypothetical protein